MGRMMEKIRNYKTYTDGMAKTFADKAWFVEKLPPHIDTLIDFGCADGAFIAYIERTYPNRFKYFIAVDYDDKMLRTAKKNLLPLWNEHRITFQLGLNDLSVLDTPTSVLVLNSVLHEVFSYCEPKEYDEFFANIRRLDFPFVAIRDMSTDIENWNLQEQYEMAQIFKAAKPELWRSMDKCGLENFDAVSFLLKYRYQENWARERMERYLWNVGYIVTRELKGHYKVQEAEKFFIPFIFEQAKRDFPALEIEPFNTHIKMLLAAA
jgi:SAM-dependent methyltransferase